MWPAGLAPASLPVNRFEKRYRGGGEGRIPVLLNLAERRIEVYTRPGQAGGAPGYAQRQDFGVGTRVPLILDGASAGTLAVEEVLG
ncbi:MAG: hypothetical protein N2378_18895 [Chloroflexaceae bacterium]|nr:hypothetical protein [Chloroflexaceae bacterium]